MSISTKTWTVTVKKADVFFDIDMLSLAYSEMAAADAPLKADHIATETASDGGRRIITRMCDHRVSDLRQLLEKFIAPVTATTANDTLVTGDWTFNIRISVEAEDNTLATITDLCHEYIVSGALADYYAQIGQQGNRESLQARAAEALSRIKELIYFRPYPQS